MLRGLLNCYLRFPPCVVGLYKWGGVESQGKSCPFTEIALHSYATSHLTHVGTADKQAETASWAEAVDLGESFEYHVVVARVDSFALIAHPYLWPFI